MRPVCAASNCGSEIQCSTWNICSRLNSMQAARLSHPSWQDLDPSDMNCLIAVHWEIATPGWDADYNDVNAQTALMFHVEHRAALMEFPTATMFSAISGSCGWNEMAQR